MRFAVVCVAAAFLFQTQALAGAGDTSWMLQAKYGVFLHYQHRILLGYSHGTAALGTKPKLAPVSEMTAPGWNRFVDGFDVEGFADQMAEGQVGWVLFCLDDHYFGWPCAPNKTFDEYTGYAPGERCSRRDLIGQVADALAVRGVKLICYYAGLNGCMEDPQSWTGLLKDFGLAQLKRIALAVKGDQTLSAGASVPLGEKTATIQRMDALPYVQSEFTGRFRFDSFNNPKLKELRERYGLDAVVAPGRDEFERQVLLLDWVHHRFKKFGKPSCDAKGALQILQAIDDGHTFFCSHYAHVLVSAAASLGWIDRELALRRHQDLPGGGSSEHAVTEIWSNQYRKWVMMDPTANMHIEKDGIPLNAYEIRQEWFYREGQDLVFVVGKVQKKYRKSDLPIFLGRFAGFGDLTVPADELDKYGFIGYIPNTDLMDAGLDYGQMFIVKDKLCEGTRWHQRIAPPDPAVDPYFPINQAALRLVPEQDQFRVTLRTLTPNFRAYEARMNGGVWRSCGDSFRWSLHPGSNQLEVRTVNQFGVKGPISTVEVEQMD